MNLSRVRIRPLRRSGSTSQELLDDDFQEPTGPYWRNDVSLVLDCQVYFERHERHTAIFAGDTVPISGRLVFKTKDLDTKLTAAGLTELRNGDLITGLSYDLTDTFRDCEYLIVEVKPTAWLRGTPNTVTAQFTGDTETINGAKGVR